MKIKGAKKVLVALSGGVDSAAAAALLVRAGYQVEAFHLRLWSEQSEEQEVLANKCCTLEAQKLAEQTARKLAIPFHLINLSYHFYRAVVDYFLTSCRQGLTPNPCVRCNKLIKFGQLYDYAMENGFDYLATGHYAKIVIRNTQHVIRNTQHVTRETKHVTCYLLRARDLQKDQTYFLYNLTQDQLAHLLFPIGEYTKTQVRTLAKKWGLPVAERPESQEICFFPEDDYRPFLRRHLKLVSGEVVNTQNEVIGRHFGLPLYTLGQRHGFDLKRSHGGPYFVIKKDILKNRLIVGSRVAASIKFFFIKDLHLINPQSEIRNWAVFCRIRHQGELVKVAKWQSGKVLKKIRVILEKPIFGVAPGQSAVFYCGSELLGGGVIG
jgi:tRNA-specific 2-thiouridylase